MGLPPPAAPRTPTRGAAKALVVGLLLMLVGVLLASADGASAAYMQYRYSSSPTGVTWTVPWGVTSVSLAADGGEGGNGGSGTDGSNQPSGGWGGSWIHATATIGVNAGDVIGAYPGGPGGGGSTNAAAGTGGGVGGLDSYSGGNYNGGTGGNTGSTGPLAGGGGGGGAASLLTVNGTVALIAAGGGGGGGSGGRGNANGDVRYDASYGRFASGTPGQDGPTPPTNECNLTVGGGGGGGGGGWIGGVAGTLYQQWYTPGYTWGCMGFAGSAGRPYYPSSGATNVDWTFEKADTSTQVPQNVVIGFTPVTPSAPDLVAASDTGVSSTDDVTNAHVLTFTGTATGGSSVQLYGRMGNAVGDPCTADMTTGAWACSVPYGGDTARSYVQVRASATLQTPTPGIMGLPVSSWTTTSDWSPEVVLDNVAPTITTFSRADLGPNDITYITVFSEAIEGYTTADIAASGTSGTWTATSVAADTRDICWYCELNQWHFTIHNGSPASGDVTPSVTGTVTDPAGNVLVVPVTGPTAVMGQPVNTQAPTLSRTPVVGESLNAWEGSWSATYPVTGWAYQWQRSADASTGWTDISGATSRAYKAVNADLWGFVRCVVTASNSFGSTVVYAGPTHRIGAPSFVVGADYFGEGVTEYPLDVNGNIDGATTQRTTTGNTPYFLAVHPDQHTLYVSHAGVGPAYFAGTADAGVLNTYRVADTGALTSLGSINIGTGAKAMGVAVSPNGKWVYLAAAGLNKVLAYSVNPNGTLTAVGSGVATGATPREVAVSRDSSAVFVTNEGGNSVSRYTVDATTGALTSAGTTSVGSGARGIAMSPTADFAYVVAQNDARIYQFSVGAGATLTPLTPAYVDGQTAVDSIGINAAGTFMAAGAISDASISVGVRMLGIAADGTLAKVADYGGADWSRNAEPIFSPNGAYLYTGTRAGMSYSQVSGTGTLSNVRGMGNGGATYGYTYKTALLRPALGPLGIAASSGALSRTAPTFTVSFTRAVTGFTASDLTVGGTATGVSVASVTGSGSGPYTIATSLGAPTTGTVTLALADNSVTDVMDTTGPTATYPSATSTTASVDNQGPEVTDFSSSASTPTKATSVAYSLTFSEAATDVTYGDFSNAGTATGCNFAVSADSGTTRTVTVTSCSQGTIIPRIAAGAAKDAVNNTGPAEATSASTTITRDTTAPTVQSFTSSDTTPTMATSISFDLTFDESVTGVAAGDFTNTGTATGCAFSPGTDSGATRTVTVTGCVRGTIIPRFAAVGATDLAGNTGPGTASTATTTIVRNAAPTVSTPATVTYTDTAEANTFTAATGTLSGSDANSDALTYGISGGTTDATYSTKAGTLGTLRVTIATGAYRYTPTASAVNALLADATDTFTVTVSDGLSSGSATFTASVTAANDTPVVTAVPLTIADTAAADAPAAQTGTLAATDAESQAVTWGISAGEAGTWTLAWGAEQVAFDQRLAGTYGTLYVESATGRYRLEPGAAAVNGATATVSATFTAVATDAGSASGSALVTTTVTGVNDRPIITVPSGIAAGALTYTEGDPAGAVLSGVVASDADTANLVGASVTISAGRTAGDALAFTNDGSTMGAIAGTYDGQTGVLALSGTAAVAQYQAALRAVTFVSTSARPTATSTTRTLTWATDDGQAANHAATTVTSTITVVDVNRDPVALTPSPETFTDTAAADTFTDVTGVLSTTDPDGDALTYGIQSATTGGWTVGGASYDIRRVGTYATLYVSSGTGAYRLVPGAVAINGATASTSEQFMVTADDGTATVASSLAVTVAGVNDPPSLATPDTAAVTDTTAFDLFLPIQGTLAGTDRDSGQALTYGITGGVSGGPTVVLVNGMFGRFDVGTATGQYMYSPARDIVNQMTSDVTEDFAVTVTDGIASASATFHVAIDGSPEAPVIGWGPLTGITFPTPLSAAVHLNATATDAFTGNAVAGTFAYTDAGNAVTDGTVLAAGTHTLHVAFTPTGATAAAYVATAADTQLLVADLAQSVTATASTTTPEYGQAVTLGLSGQTGTGAVSFAVASGPCEASGSTLMPTGVGTCQVTGTIAADANHLGATSPQLAIAVGPATLTVTADARTKRIGATDPALTYVVTGYRRLDTATVITTPVAISRAPGEALGDYAITPSGAAAANYVFSYVPAALAIVAKDVPVLQWPTPAGITYGTTLGAQQLAPTAVFGGTPVPGTFTFTRDGAPVAAGAVLHAGDQALTATFAPTNTTDFASGTTVQAVLSVARRPVTVAGATVTDRDYDGTTTATADLSRATLVGVRAGDAVTLTTRGATATFDSPLPGTGRVAQVAGLALGGDDAADHVLVPPAPAATIRAVVPGPPTGASAVPGDRQAMVTWDAPAFTGGLPITGYTVTADPGGQSCAWSGGPRECMVTGLDTGTAYAFTVRAVTAAGAGPASSPSAPVTPVPSSQAGVRTTAEVTADGTAPVSVTCASTTQACTTRVTLRLGGVPVAGTRRSVPPGASADIPVELPPAVLRNLGRTGRLVLRAVTITEVDGREVRTVTTIVITAPAADGFSTPQVDVATDGSAAFSGTCQGALGSRCSGRINLYASRSVLQEASPRPAAEGVLVGSTTFGGPAGAVVHATAKPNAQGRRLLARSNSLKVRPVIVMNGATRVKGAPAATTMRVMSPRQWLRTAIATLSVGGRPRVELNRVLDLVAAGAMSRSDAARAVKQQVIPGHRAALARAAALPTPVASLRPAAALLLRAFRLSVAADTAYLRWLTHGTGPDDTAWRLSRDAASVKRTMMRAFAAAAAPRHIAVPRATTLWP